MALYTLKSENEAMNPELYKNRVQGFAGLSANAPELQLFNMFGRNSGGASQSDDNFFAKKARSIENALGTTGAFIAGGVDVRRENDLNEKRQENAKKSIEDIIKSHGYNSKDEFYDASNKAEREIFGKYGFDSDDYWNKHAEMWSPAKANDKDVLALEATRQDVINRMSQEDADTIRKFDSIQDELKGQSKKNADIANKASKDWKDYRENSYIGQKTNQDRGKFLGSAINTLSTASDVMLPGAGVAFNAVQGGIEGIADELEQNGLENFDWGRAGQNALTGATVGAVTGAVNKGLSNALAKRGGNLLKGGNKLTAGLNKFNANNPVGQLASTLGTGAARGAVSGAVGGATGAGLQSALAGQDVGQGISNALQGAVQGAQQGATTGAIMTGANMVANKTPGVGNVMQQLNEAGENWKNSGRTFDERLTNTLNSGDSAVGNWLNRKTQSNLLGSAGSIGNRIQDTANVGNIDPWDRLAQQSGYNNYDEVIQKYMEANPNTPLNPNGAAGQILTWLDQNPNTPTTAKGWLKRAGERVVEDANNRGVGLSIKDVANENQSYTDDIKKMQINQNDMLGYTDENTEPITVAEALKRAGVNSAQKAPSMEQSISEEVGTSTTTKNPQTQLYDALMNDKSSTENRLRNAAGLKLQQQYGTIDKPTAKATNAPETLQKIAKAGFTKPADVERMASAITGSNGEVSKLVSNLVATAKPINTFDGETSGQSLNDYIDLSIQKRGLDGIDEGKAVKSQINALMKSLPSRAEGSISYVDDPTDAFKMTQLLDAEAANYEGRSGLNYGTTNPDKLRAAQVIKDVSNLLKDRIYDTVDVKQALTPEVAENLKAYAPNNKEWANYVDNEIMTANSVKDLRSVQAPWVRANKIIDNGYMNSITYGGRNGGNGSPIPLTKKGLIGMALGATVNSKPGLRTQAKVLNKVADIAGKTQSGESSNVNSKTATTVTEAVANPDYNPQTRLYDAIGRTEGAITRNNARNGAYLAEAAQEAEVVPNTIMQTANIPTTDSSTALYNSVTGIAPAQTATTASTQGAMPSYGSQSEEQATYFFPPTGDYWSDMLSQAMRRAKNAGDYDALGQLFEMYQTQASKLEKQASSEKDYSNPINWSATDRKSLLQAQNGLGQIDSLADSYVNAVGEGGSNFAQGGLRNIATNIFGGNLDPSATEYVKQANSLGAGIIKNLINLGSTEYDAQRYIDYLPSLTDTKEQAAQKLQKLRQAYEDIIGNLQTLYSAQ